MPEPFFLRLYPFRLNQKDGLNHSIVQLKKPQKFLTQVFYQGLYWSKSTPIVRTFLPARRFCFTAEQLKNRFLIALAMLLVRFHKFFPCNCLFFDFFGFFTVSKRNRNAAVCKEKVYSGIYIIYTPC